MALGAMDRTKGAGNATNSVSNSGSKNLNNIKGKLSNAKNVNGRLETMLPDGGKVTFHQQHSHPIGAKYPNSVDHYNVRVWKPLGNGRYKETFNGHIIIDNMGNVTDYFYK